MEKEIIHLDLKERHCYGHVEIDIIISRQHRTRKYKAISEATCKRLEQIIPEWFVNLDAESGIEVYQVWRPVKRKDMKA